MNIGEVVLTPTTVKVSVTNPESPFGGVQIEGLADQPIQVAVGKPGEVQSVFGRTGNVLPLCADYDQCYMPLNPVGPDLPSSGATDHDVTPLVIGQSYVDVSFAAQPNTDWIFVQCMILNTTDPIPLNIWPGIVSSKTTTGFRLNLNGLPDTGNYYLHWAIGGTVIPPFIATFYSLSGPSSGPFGSPVTFTVSLPESGTLDVPVIITPDDSGGGGAFVPTSVTLTTAHPSKTFTYTPAGYGTISIAVTNDGDLSDPVPIVFTCIAPTYTLTGPTGGVSGVASTPFTVTLSGAVSGTVTITPSSGAGGGTFTPTTVALTTGAPSTTFTYTPVSGGTKTISVTNSGGLTNPGSLTYTVSAPVTPHLLNTLISYWKLDEASGTRNDSNGTNHLTLGNLPAGATGKINNGALFVMASSQSAGILSNSTLQVTGSFTISFWIKLTSQTLTVPLSKWSSGGMEYSFVYDPAVGIQFATASVVTADVALGPTIANGVWAHVVGWFDSATGITHLRLNDATTYNGTVPTATIVGLSRFYIGGTDAVGFYVDALIDEVGFWKRTLTAQEITALYNGGAGLPYSSFTS